MIPADSPAAWFVTGLVSILLLAGTLYVIWPR